MVQLPEKSAPGTPLPVYRMIATDRDEGRNCQVTYSLEENGDDFFTIHPVTGMVFSKKAFSAQEYNILTVSGREEGMSVFPYVGNAVIGILLPIICTFVSLLASAKRGCRFVCFLKCFRKLQKSYWTTTSCETYEIYQLWKQVDLYNCWTPANIHFSFFYFS